jgi:hypothetical protein
LRVAALAALLALPEPIALAVHFQDVDVVGQSIQERADEMFRAEELGPVLEGQVAGDQC